MNALLVLMLILTNGVLAMTELALVSARRVRLETAAARGDRRAAAALRVAESPNRFLSTTQIGITLIGILSGALGEKALSADVEARLRALPWLEPYAGWLSLLLVVLGITYASLILGELVPKRVAMLYPEAIARYAARPMTVLARVAAPAVWVLSKSTELVLGLLGGRGRVDEDVSEEEVRGMIEKGEESGLFRREERELLDRALRLGDLRVKSLMVPRADVEWLDASLSVDAARSVAAVSTYAHFPVCEGGFDRPVGIVHVRDLVRPAEPGETLASRARRPLFVPEATPAVRLVETFRTERTTTAITVNEFGGTEGLVSLTDIVHALIGDAAMPERAGAPDAVRREDGSWLVDGLLSLHELERVLEVEPLNVEEFGAIETVSGLVMAVLGRVPRTGEVATWNRLRLEVVDMDGRRVDRVLVHLEPLPSGEDGAPRAGAEGA